MKRFIIYILSLSFAVACAKFGDETLSTSVTLGDEVAMTLSIGVNSITGEAEELPSITVRAEVSDGLIDDISSEVMNLWVLQFDGTSDDSKIISMSYIDIEDSEVTTLVGQSPKINFVATPESTTILFLANTFDAALIPSLNCTLADVKALNYPVVTNLEDPEDLSSAQLSYANGLATEDADGTKYFTMSSSMDLQVSESESETELNVKLLRNAVKLTFVLNNEWSDSELISISLRDASENVYYYSSYLTDESDGSYLDTNGSFPQSTSPVDYQTTTLSIFEAQSQTITFYAPANLKGVIPISTQESKSYYAPSTSTYIYIEALYDETHRYYYTYYLGGDLEMDYNLLPNHAYTYTLNFNEGGSANTDYSINAYEVDYTLREASNCYILNPSSSVDVFYYIPIKSRINTFWAEYATITNQRSDRLNSDTDWDYAVLWYDNDDSPICPAEWDGDTDISIPSTKQVKIERIEDYNGMPALKVTLPQHFDNEGNMVVAVFDRDGTLTDDGYHAKSAIKGDILWSWHFWITDYNPDSRSHTPVSGYYQYAVDGGEIHRYKDNEDAGYDAATKLTHATNHTYYTVLWDGGAYSNSFIMDRNLGARGSSYTEQGAGPIGSVLGTSRYYIPGALYFQAGRKDPFVGNIGMFLTGKDEDGNYLYEYLDIENGYTTNSRRERQNVGTQDDDSQCDYSFEDAVLRPTVYFYSSNSTANWTSEEAANSLSCLWSDEKLENTTEAYYDITEKSIFDPSPLGWRMPIRGTWDNFNCDPTSGSGNPATAFATYIPITGSNESREYELCGAIYPGASGLMVAGDFFKTAYLETLSWSATPYDRAKELESTTASSFYSSYLGAYASGVFPQGASWHYRQIGMPVRPVKCQ